MERSNRELPLENIGTKAELKAPSANIRRNGKLKKRK
jgi:hypothetical protein